MVTFLKNYTLTHTVYPEYLEVEMQGEVDPSLEQQEAFERWRKIADLCRQTDRTSALVISYFIGSYTLNTSFNM
jgi:hypothetical protein